LSGEEITRSNPLAPQSGERVGVRGKNKTGEGEVK